MEEAVKPSVNAIESIANDERNKANQVVVLDADNKYAKMVTDIQFGQDGIVNYKGDKVRGLYDKVKERFDKESSDINKNLFNDDQRAAVAKVQSNYWQNLDANVQRHTSSELEKYDIETTASGLKNQQTLAANNSFDMKQVADSVTKQHTILMDFAARSGKPSSWVEEKTKEAVSETYVEVIKAMLVNDQVKTAKGFFDRNKASIDPTKALAMDAAIDGKRIYGLVEKVSEFSIKARLDDGTMDLKAIHEYVKGMGMSPEDTYKVESHINSIYAVDTAETKQRQTNALTTASNTMIDYQARGVPYSEALKLGQKFGWNNASIADIQDAVTKVYASPMEKFNTWITKQPQDVQSAWAETTNLVKAKYGNSKGEVAGVQQKLGDAALNELKQDVLGKNADQIRAITEEKLKKVVISHYSILGMTLPDILQSKKESFKVDAGVRQGLSEAYTLMEKDYGADRVSKARAWLALNGKAITPANTKALLDSQVKQNAKNR